jgi:hypothetical protein
MSRRVWFFVGAALVCLVLIPVAPADFRWVPMVVAAVYGALAALTGLEHWVEERRLRRREP